jgi:hypothetical protein
MVFYAVDIFSLILFLVWQCLNTTPKKQKSWIYSRVFPSQVVLESILACASIIFAPALFETLQNASGRISKRWAAYVIVLEKQGCRPKLYVGSGTQAQRGVSNRLVQYNEAHVGKGACSTPSRGICYLRWLCHRT